MAGLSMPPGKGSALLRGAALGALLGLAEAAALMWTGALRFETPRTAFSFVSLSAALYSLLGLGLASIVLLLASALLCVRLRPAAGPTLAAIPALLTFYSVCVLGHYFLEFKIRSAAFLVTSCAALLLSAALWWGLGRTPPRAVTSSPSGRRVPRLVLAAVAAAILLLAMQTGSLATARVSSPPSQPGNVLLLTLDTVRADRLGAYGDSAARTPNLDRLARSGAMFRQAYTPIVVTGPAHAALLTSGYPADHLLKNNGQRISDKVGTLAELFRAAGYHTFGAVSVIHLDGHYSSLDRGFQSFTNSGFSSPFMSLSVLRILNTWLARQGFSGLWAPTRKGPLAVDDFSSWLAANPREPFFAWLHLYDAHFPYGAGEAEAAEATSLSAEIVNSTAGPEDPRVRRVELLYDHGVSSVDSQVGRALAELSKLGLQSTTLVIVASDHGETFANPAVDRQHWFRHRDVYEDTAHVPLIMSYPGKIPPGIVIESPVSLLDVAPTTLSLLGMDAGSQRFRGVDLLPLLDGRAAGGDRPCLMIQHAPDIPGLFSWAVRQGCWKLVLRTPEDPGKLYNLCQNPIESSDVAAAYPDIASRLGSCFRAQRRYFDLPTAPLSPSKSLANNLRSLGYL